jgi:outer membrane protein assembly factor BamA
LRRDLLYAVALDCTIEYDKLLKSSFFGLGNSTSENKFQFPRELFEIEATASHAFSRVIDGGLSVRLAHRSVYGYDTDWSSGIARAPGIGESQQFTVGGGLNYDTRDDVINPVSGIRMALTVERAGKFAGFDWDFWKGRLELSGYQTVLRKNNILAARLWLQEVSAGAPFQELSKVGDGWTARGYRAGRFLDRAMALTSLEYRFPIYAKFGGAAFVDAGRVWPTLREFNLDGWHGNWGGGLRYYLANFVGRLDIGKSPEGTRIFFNFGQVF